jgi:hypothetical protein
VFAPTVHTLRGPSASLLWTSNALKQVRYSAWIMGCSSSPSHPTMSPNLFMKTRRRVTIGGFIRGASSAQQSHGLFVHVEGSSECKHLTSDVQSGLLVSSCISWPWLAAGVSPQLILAEVPGLLLDVGDAEKASFEKADGRGHASKPSICNDLL